MVFNNVVFQILCILMYFMVVFHIVSWFLISGLDVNTSVFITYFLCKNLLGGDTSFKTSRKASSQRNKHPGVEKANLPQYMLSVSG